MPPDDYSSAFAGGALKLKGVQSSKIEKRQKKRKRADPAENHTHSKDVSAALSTAKDEDGNGVAEEGVLDLRAKGTGGGLGKELREGDEDQEEGIAGVGMTEAERRHAESKRKRLDERLKREGIKTHKERVEDLNRYLSNLSEHHDMPRIGPG